MSRYVKYQVDVQKLFDDARQGGCYRVVNQIFDDARREYFEDGMDSAFTLSLSAAYRYFGIPFLQLVDERLYASHDSPEIISEALTWTGRIGEELPRPQQVNRVLRNGLWHPDIRVQDAAACAISSLDDPDFIPAIQEVLKYETSTWQRDWLTKVLEQLRATKEGVLTGAE